MGQYMKWDYCVNWLSLDSTRDKETYKLHFTNGIYISRDNWNLPQWCPNYQVLTVVSYIAVVGEIWLGEKVAMWRLHCQSVDPRHFAQKPWCFMNIQRLCCFWPPAVLLRKYSCWIKIARAQPVQRDSQMTVHCLDSESYLQSSCWSLHINEVCQKGQNVQQLSAKKYGWANKYQTFCLSDIYIWDLCMTYLFELIQGHIAKRTIINFTRPSQPTHLSYI